MPDPAVSFFKELRRPVANKYRTACIIVHSRRESKEKSSRAFEIFMAIRIATVIYLCCVIGLARSAIADQYKTPPGPFSVKSMLLDWKDPARNITLPVKIYYPDTPQGKFPVIIFSHGAGGSREGYSYLGQYWAGFGYVCVHLQHIGSDDSVWRGGSPDQAMSALRRSTTNPQAILNRPLDVTFAIDQLQTLNKDDPTFKDRLDLDHIGMAGHSFGAFTTLAIAGEVFTSPTGAAISWPDARVKAAIAMSESPPRDHQQWDAAFAKIAIPMMHMTGTLDDSPLDPRSKAVDRRVPFDHIPAVADQYLIILNGGDHMVFSGRIPGFALAGSGSPAMDPTFQVWIQQSTTAFWDAYLKSDPAAKKWLSNGGCQSMLGTGAKFELKPSAPSNP
jgi:predicted dienelactone hydrolase